MIRVGVVGAGFMGRMHSACYGVLPDVQLVGIADVEVEKAKEIAEKERTKAFPSLDKLLEEEIEIVDICLPTYLHREAVVKAARAKKNILCEKPIALNIKDANEMISETKKAQVKFMVAQVIRFWPEYIMLKELFDKKSLGKLKSLVCRRLSPTPTWSWQNWLMDPEKSGGALLDLHIHDTDFIYYLLGRPRAVYSQSNKTKIGHSHIISIFEYPERIVVAEGGWDFVANFPFLMAFTAVFEKGVVDFNSQRDKTLIIYNGENVEFPEIESQKIEGGGNISDLGGYYNEIKYFVECVKSNREPEVVTPESARDSLDLVLTELKSAEARQKILL